MKINFYKGIADNKSLMHSYYIHPTLKIQPYGWKSGGFELVLWWIKYYISIRITWYK